MSLRRLLSLPALVLALTISTLAATPGVADHAPDFTLPTPGGASLQLSSLTDSSRIVLVVLRGYPGYQCPYSLQQFNDFQQSAAQFAALNTQVVFIYPGPSSNLAAEANDFAAASSMPDNFHLVIDPDFTVTSLYGLRWNASNETAYPSTFIIQKDGSIFSAQVGKSHGDHPTAADTLAALNADTPGSKQP
ncbi:MAG TPA: redoxin domain-containing protein [Edaphobacter sp.]|nr:redoxin domain-containing protein [Edaphobacter sp.]